MEHNEDDLIQRLNQVAHNWRTATATGQCYCVRAEPTLNISEVSNVEQEFGFSLPPLLVRLYAEVGNGGFGPNLGLLPLTNRHNDGCILSEYAKRRAWRKGNAFSWPERMLPCAEIGCGAFYCVWVIESGEPSPPVIKFEPNLSSEAATRAALHGDQYVAAGFLPLRKTLFRWLSDWLEGGEKSPRELL